ncbi:helix-turn-helix domain-containing protein [Clostridium perfringens]|uniref:Putative transcriptional regulator n=1 Tax=Clostridium perfringens TaxID=1502 RepID=A0A140GRE9_CLOPF|nr:helix-turn-helix domain-containing protein [Clostridium perfringens]AMN31108.1 putative transcriptional regulator [Clostridium perfringens]
MFEEVLKNIRIEKGLTQKELAEMIYTTPQNIAHYEHGRRSCTIEQAIELLDKLGIDVVISKGKIERNVRMAVKYYDKHGNEIKENSIIRDTTDGELRRVFLTDNDDLGLDCTNYNYAFRNPLVIYLTPLSEFCLNDWEVVDEKDLTEEELKSVI